MPQFESSIFEGTDEEAATLFRKLNEEGLTPEEEFVACRYFDRVVPKHLEHFYNDLDDKPYNRVQKRFVSRVIKIATQAPVSAD